MAAALLIVELFAMEGQIMVVPVVVAVTVLVHEHVLAPQVVVVKLMEVSVEQDLIMERVAAQELQEVVVFLPIVPLHVQGQFPAPQ